MKINYEYGELQTSGSVDGFKNNGNLAKQVITVPTIAAATGFVANQSYAYDSLDRLKSAAETISGQTWKQTFNYDRFGNKTFDVANTTIISSESAVPKIANPEILPNSNKYKQDQDNDSQPDYLYDASGNITKNARQQDFTYDAENRQITAVGPGLSTSYSYDGNGKRVKSHNSINGQTTIFVYDADGDLTAEFTVNVPPPTSPTISYLTEDALGSVRVTTNSFGEVKARRDFLPFGEELYAGLAGRNTNQEYSSNTDDTRKKFATYQRDTETGLDFAQSRYYSPMQGRFTSPDEFKGGPKELYQFEKDGRKNPTFYGDLKWPQSLNKYQYAYNNPYKYNDPSGHCPKCPIRRPPVRTAVRPNRNIVPNRSAAVRQPFGPGLNDANQLRQSRQNLQNVILVPAGPPNMIRNPGPFVKHHIFPQAGEFAPQFNKAGINIHQFKISIPVSQHRALHSGIGHGRGGQWNNQWKQFFDANPKATPSQIFNQANRMIANMAVIGRLVPYRNPTPYMQAR